MGPDAINEEKEEAGRTTEERETTGRRISAGVCRHHTNHQRIMVRM